MKFETKKAENYNSLFISFEIPFTKQTFRFHTMLYASPKDWVHGYSSRTENGQYVLFMDYDSLDFQAIKSEAIYLQKKFKLSNFYIFKLDRENSFHAVCLDKFPISEAYEILKQTSCDQAFIHAIKRLQSREWILRIGKKGNRAVPVFLGCIKSNYEDYHYKSNAHKEFLEKAGVDKKYFAGKKWDKSTKLSLVDYTTSNRIK